VRETVVGFILKGYPRLSETFVLREILLLEERGHSLHIFAMRHPRESRVHEMVSRVRARVTYVPDHFYEHLGALTGANLRLWLRRPGRYGSALWHASVRSLHERRVATLKRFFQAAYLVEAALPGTGVTHFHAHFCHDPTTVAFFASWLSGIPYSFSAHAKDIYTQPEDVLREKLHGARFVTTCTDYNRAHLARCADGSTPILRCYHGVDLDAFTPPPEGPRGKDAHILSVGRLVAKKGFPILLDALGMLRERGHRFCCTIVGDGPLEAMLRARIAALGLEAHVTLRGPMAQGELIEVYRSVDLFALACEVQDDGDRDGIPNVLLEAMAMAIPVVSTRVSGIPECVAHGVNGLLVPEKDPQALAEAMASLLEHAERARQLGRAGRRRVEKDFHAARNVEPIAAALWGAIEGERSEAQYGVG